MRLGSLLGSGFGILALAVALLTACGSEPPSLPADLSVAPDLEAHTAEFERRVVEVTEGVHVAVGFALANSILISGDGGRIIVDTTESVETAQEVKAAFDAIDPSPVRAIVYTHNHGDHVFGAGVFAEGGAVEDADEGTTPEVYAHETTTKYLDRVINVVRPILTVRSARMFGNHLDEAGLVNAGIGRELALYDDSTIAPLRPTVTFEDSLAVEIAGVRLELYHAPGETDDQLFVWLPDRRVLLPGDNLYKTFPNLYTIRGTPYRDVVGWVKSLDAMRRLRPEHLVPSHTGPISGAERVEKVLTDYRDAIQFVHDQTVRCMNRGLTPDELAGTVKLPPHLAASPYLAELYGTAAWSARSVFAGYLGWFDGNPTNLDPLSPDDRARRLAELAGGGEALLEKAREASSAGEHRWVLELTDALLRLDPPSAAGQDLRAAARDLRVTALFALGEAASNPNARHYYLTSALELRDGLKAGLTLRPSAEVIRATPLEVLFTSLAVNLDPVAAADLDRKVAFVFPDSGEAFTLHVRRGVAEVQPRLLSEPDQKVTVDSDVWKEIVAGLRNPATALLKGELKIEGGTLDVVRFLDLFEPPDE